MESLLKESYTLRDAAAKREPRDFAQRMLRTAKNADINDVGPQLDMIYTNIDLSLRMYLQRPTKRSTVDSFLSDIDDRKYEWWAFASKRLEGPLYRSKRPPLAQQHRYSNQINEQRPSQYQGQYPPQYSPRPVDIPYRPVRDSYQGQRPYYKSNNPYGGDKPFPRPPYQTRPLLNASPSDNVNQTQYQPQQPYQSRQQSQPPSGGRPSLQITNGNVNQSPGQRAYTSPYQRNEGGRDFNRNPFKRPFPTTTKAYHANEGQENTPSDD